METTEEVDNIGDKSNALSDIARSLTQAEESTWPILERWVTGTITLQNMSFREMKKEWMGSLHATAGKSALLYVIRALSWLPLDAESSVGSVYNLMAMIIGLRRIDAASAIARACPQLRLTDIFD